MCVKPYIKKYFFFYLLGLIAVILVDVIQLKVPEITGNITDLLQKNTMTESLLTANLKSLIFVGVMIVILRFLWRYFIFGTSRKIEYGLRNDFFAHLESLSSHFFHKNKTGDLMAYATNDLSAIRMMFGPGVLMLLDSVIMTTIVVIRMVNSTTLLLTLLALIPMPLIAVNSLLLGKVIERRFDEKQEAFAKLSDLVQENISGIRVVKAFVQESFEIVFFNRMNQQNYEKNMRVVRVHALMFPLAMTVTGVSIAIALGYGGQLAILGTITLGKFVAFIQYIMMLIWPMIAFGWFVNIYSQGTASLKRFQEILDTRPEIVDESKAYEATAYESKAYEATAYESEASTVAANDYVEESRNRGIGNIKKNGSESNQRGNQRGDHNDDHNGNHVHSIQGNIRIENLAFRYPESEEAVLKNITLEIQKGQTIGIVGRTGCGKSTFVNLLLRMFDVEDGNIYIDNRKIKDWPLKELRSSIGYVPQDTFLFSDTIKHNIGFGLDQYTDEAIEAAAVNVDVHENIIEFEEGYNTVIGERGVTLSGGQKQRVAIARALIKNPPILILDDSVSAVDTKTEERILEHLREVRKDKTTLVIAHRISTIQDADLIVVLDEGTIAERGTHGELVRLGGIYASMVQMQQLEKAIEEVE